MPELARRITIIENRLVSKDVYERDIREIREDTSEIKDTLKWAMRLLVGQFLALVIALLFFFLNQLPV